MTVTPTSESASELAPRRLQPAADDCASRDGHGRGCKDKRESDYDKPPREGRSPLALVLASIMLRRYGLFKKCRLGSFVFRLKEIAQTYAH